MTPPTARERARRIVATIDRAENFAMSHDGPAPKTSEVLDGEEELEQLLRDAYIVATAYPAAERAAAERMRERCARAAHPRTVGDDEDLDDYEWGAVDGRYEAARLIRALPLEDTDAD